MVDHLTTAAVAEIRNVNLAKEARLMTDEGRFYKVPDRGFAADHSVSHAHGEYVSRADATVHTNPIKGFFSIFKRGMKVVDQHCSKKHLHRYMAEFDFRCSNRSALGCGDQDRTMRAVLGGSASA